MGCAASWISHDTCTLASLPHRRSARRSKSLCSMTAAGAALRQLPVGPGSDLLAELERAVKHSVPSPLARVLNFPSNPTAQTVDLDFYGEVVAFCRHQHIYILSDLA